ncbi:MAG: MFS transporter [Chloroflexi bacterium]|nr:MFS transporter [Chloroflexota bacterium]
MSMLESGRAAAVRLGTALQYRDYRTLWLANVCGGAASWALIVARGWLVYEISDSSLWVGVVTFAAMIPRMLVTPFTGYLSDRFNRRNVLAVMFTLNLVHNLILAIVVLTGSIQIWHLVVLSLFNGSARAAQMPAAQALIPNLVPKNLLLNAIALNQATNQGSRLIGPAMVAPLLATTGVESAFFLCTGFYAISLIQVLRIRTVSKGAIDKSKKLINNMTEGFSYVYKTPIMRAITIMALFHCGLTMSFESLLPVLSSQQLNAEGAGFSYMMMAVGAGALVSAITLAGIRSETTRGRLFLYMGLLSGVTPILLALSFNMPMALAAAAGMGASQAGFMTITHTMIQSIVPDGIRGRVAGIYSMHVGGMMASINLINGALADYISAPVLLSVGGVLFIVIMFLSLRRVTIRQIYSRGLGQEAYSAAN